MLACRFQEIHRAERIHVEIEQGNLSRLIVRRLRRAVDDQIEALRSKEFFDGCSVANVQRRMCEPLGHTLQPLQIPERVARGAEENAAHVVVHAHNFMPLPVKVLGRFRTDQSTAAGDQNFHPFESIPLPMRRKSINAVEFPRTAFLKIAEIGDERAAPSLEEYQQSSGFLTAPRQVLLSLYDVPTISSGTPAAQRGHWEGVHKLFGIRSRSSRATWCSAANSAMASPSARSAPTARRLCQELANRRTFPARPIQH